LAEVHMRVPEAGDEPAPVALHGWNSLRIACRVDRRDEAVPDQDVNQVGGGKPATVERNQSHLAQQQRGHRVIIA
jgi:hypothetical protein